MPQRPSLDKPKGGGGAAVPARTPERAKRRQPPGEASLPGLVPRHPPRPPDASAVRPELY